MDFGLRDGRFDGKLLAVGTHTIDRAHAPHAAAGHMGLAKVADVLVMFGAEPLQE